MPVIYRKRSYWLDRIPNLISGRTMRRATRWSVLFDDAAAGLFGIATRHSFRVTGTVGIIRFLFRGAGTGVAACESNGELGLSVSTFASSPSEFGCADACLGHSNSDFEAWACLRTSIFVHR